MSDVKTHPKIVADQPPQKAWRNWWIARRDTTFVGGPFPPKSVKRGEVFPSNGTYPSKDVAEAYSQKQFAIWRGVRPANYLGAFPEGVRP